MMGHRQITTDECDAFTGWRHVLPSMQRAGARRKIARRTHRRLRREGRAEIRAQLRDTD